MIFLRPDYLIRHVTDLSPEWLRQRSVRGIVADLDNTLVGWHSEAIPPEVAAWLSAIRLEGISVCIASNTRNFARLRKLSEALSVLHVPGNAGKPSSKGIRTALSLLSVDPKYALMVGDQLFTDMVAGRRAGLTTVLVNPLTTRDFIGTKVVSRNLERLVLRGDRARPT